MAATTGTVPITSGTHSFLYFLSFLLPPLSLSLSLSLSLYLSIYFFIYFQLLSLSLFYSLTLSSFLTRPATFTHYLSRSLISFVSPITFFSLSPPLFLSYSLYLSHFLETQFLLLSLSRYLFLSISPARYHANSLSQSLSPLFFSISLTLVHFSALLSFFLSFLRIFPVSEFKSLD
ncbi:unnamed protein product [Acanthosepion pharaonis]|uniref:Uncharacterized protein n=1 Tax=Acanthosepion pharaonis TaxID=158019 RepID=A0A812BJ40_ACAPH|nr:unnamed protein product [Sepia pharaonis]